MVLATTTPSAPSLAAYRTQHKIVVDDSGPLPVCRTDGIRIHPTRVGGWIHDQATTDRLHREDIKAMVDAAYPTPEQLRVALAIERISADFHAELDEDDDDHDFEGDPAFNGSFR